MSRSALGAFSASRPPQRYDFQDESSFRNSLKKYLDQLSQAMTSDVLGPSGIPITYDGATDVLTLDAGVQITGVLDLDATGPGALVQAGAGGVVTADNPLRTAFGGTGLTTFGAAGRLLYSTAAGVLAALAIGSSGQIVRSNGSFPAYSTFTIPDTFSRGDVLVVNPANAIVAKTIATAGKMFRSDGTDPQWSTFTHADTFASGDLVYASGLNAVSGLTIGASAKWLRSNGSAPSWQTLTASEVTAGNLPYAQLPTGGGTWANGGTLLLTGGLLTVSAGVATPATYTVDKATAGTPTVVGLDLKNTAGTNTPQLRLGLESYVTSTASLEGKVGGASLAELVRFDLSTKEVKTFGDITASSAAAATTISSIDTLTTGVGRFKAQGDTNVLLVAGLGSAFGGTTFGGVTGNNQAVIEAQSASSLYIGTSSAISMYLAPNRVPVLTVTTSRTTSAQLISVDGGTGHSFGFFLDEAGTNRGYFRLQDSGDNPMLGVYNGGTLYFGADSATSETKRMAMSTSALFPTSDLGMTLGGTSNAWGALRIGGDIDFRVSGTRKSGITGQSVSNQITFFDSGGSDRLKFTMAASSSGITDVTSDGSDNGQIYVSAGGSQGISRGGYVVLYGNEHANTGSVRIEAGDVAGGEVLMYTRGGQRFRVTDTGFYQSYGTYLIRCTNAMTNNAGSGSGTLTNAPTAGNPTKWIAIDDAGTTRSIPAW